MFLVTPTGLFCCLLAACDSPPPTSPTPTQLFGANSCDFVMTARFEAKLSFYAETEEKGHFCNNQSKFSIKI